MTECQEYNYIEARANLAHRAGNQTDRQQYEAEMDGYMPVCFRTFSQDPNAGNRNDCPTCGDYHEDKHWIRII